MRKLLLPLLVLFFACSSKAAILSYDVSASTVAVGDSIDVTLIGEFESGVEFFDSFNFDLLFNDSLVALQPGSLTTNLPVDIDSIFDGYELAGTGASAVYTHLAQSFTGTQLLVSFTLEALTVGTVSLGLDILELADYGSQVFDVPVAFNPVSFSVVSGTATDVPAPTVWSLLLMGLVMVGVKRRYRKD